MDTDNTVNNSNTTITNSISNSSDGGGNDSCSGDVAQSASLSSSPITTTATVISTASTSSTTSSSNNTNNNNITWKAHENGLPPSAVADNTGGDTNNTSQISSSSSQESQQTSSSSVDSTTETAAVSTTAVTTTDTTTPTTTTSNSTSTTTSTSTSTSTTTSTNSNNNSSSTSSTYGPDPIKLRTILERTNYSHQVTAGQRKYGGPPPDWDGPAPASGCEIFVGRISKDVYEDELIVLFEKIGKLWDLRLMIDPVTSQSRGYGFITYCNQEDAQKAVQEMNNYRIRQKSLPLKVNISVPNVRLFIGNIPKVMSKEQIFTEFNKVTEGLVEVITYSSPDDRKKNRGFCFLEFDSHKNASAAKRKLTTSGVKIFKCDILVDWADPQEEPDEETMSKVKVLYVRNLTSDVTESQIKTLFEEYGSVERVKKIKDYAFVHFEDREQALHAMSEVNGKDFGGSCIEISLAKPPSDRRKKEEMLRNRERRMFAMMQQKQYNMMSFSRVPPPNQLRGGPMPPMHPLPPPQMIPPPMRGTGSRNNRFSQMPPVNPMMAPVTFNRQGQPWNPLLFYDPSEWWFNGGGAPSSAHHRGGGGSGGAATAAQAFNFPPNMPPLPGAGVWPYGPGMPNGAAGQIPPLGPPFGSGAHHSGSGRRNNNGPQHHNSSALMNGGHSGNSSSTNHRKWRKTNSSSTGGNNNNSNQNNVQNSNIANSNNNNRQK